MERNKIKKQIIELEQQLQIQISKCNDYPDITNKLYNELENIK